MTGIFLSYGRGDDEFFVKRLYEDLVAQGFDVWWDRVSMPSRALTFLQEIRDAIDSRERLILVVGESAVTSEYVRVEWQYALISNKIVTPVLRCGDYTIIPSEISRLHCPDMRESRPYDDALAELIRILNEPILALGPLCGVPSLPAHFLSRAEDTHFLRSSVLADTINPTVITSAKQITVLQGMGGVGKSVLTAAFARSGETRRAFSDGIVWVTLGQQPDLVRSLCLVGNIFGDDPSEYVDVDRAEARLARVLASKNCLLVLDDCWDVKHAVPFSNALGGRCRLLITTRDGGLATALGAQAHRLDVLSLDAAMRLLADWCGVSIDEMPPEAISAAQECGRLPFALALCGAMVRDGTPWLDLLVALREADLTFVQQQFPNYPYPDVLKSLKVSIDALANTDPMWAKHYGELAVFPPSEAVPEAAVLEVWLYTNGLNERGARQLLTTLERKSLLRLRGEAPRRQVSLHDLQHDFLRAALRDATGLHTELLAAYRQKCSHGWHTGPNDGYYFERLVYHLVQAGRVDEARDLLLDYHWLEAKIRATSVAALIADFDQLGMRDLWPIRQALRLSAYLIGDDISQLPGQLVGRLAHLDQPTVVRFLEGAEKLVGDYWLRPNFPSLYSVDSGVENHWRAYTRAPVCQLLVSKDASALAVIRQDKVEFWNPVDGTPIPEDEGLKLFPENDVSALQANLPSSWFSTRKPDAAWQSVTSTVGVKVRISITYRTPLHTNPEYGGEIVLRLGEHERLLARSCEGTTYLERAFFAAAVSPDGKLVACAGLHGEITIWRLPDLSVQISGKICDESIVAFALYPDNSKVAFLSEGGNIGIVTLSAGALGSPSSRLGLLTSPAECLYMAPSGDVAVLGTKDDKLLRSDTRSGAILQIGGVRTQYSTPQLWTKSFRVSADFRYAVMSGFGPDYYDGWYIQVSDIPAGGSVFSAETNLKSEHWGELNYVRIKDVPFLMSERGPTVNLRSGTRAEPVSARDAVSVGWLGFQNRSDRGISCEIAEEGNSICVTLPDLDQRRLLFTPDDRVTHAAISADGSCVAAACESGQIYFLSIVAPLGER